jgi:fluoride exporter
VILAKYGSEHSVRAFFVTGLLGGFTTFSAFSWDAMQMIQRGQIVDAGVYILGSVALSLGAVFIGFQLGK